MHPATCVVFLSVLSPAFALPYYDPPPLSNKQRADAIIEAFRFSWDGYYTHAFPHDELHPVTNTYSDSRYPFPFLSIYPPHPQCANN